MNSQPVETTLYSLSDAPPVPRPSPDRRDGERHMTLYRVGSMLVENRRELCLIKNISAGGMMVRLYCSVAEGTPVTIELKSGQPIHGCVSWVNDQQAGVAFDQPVDVIDILSASTNCHQLIPSYWWATLASQLVMSCQTLVAKRK